jgi:hypothetical protein
MKNLLAVLAVLGALAVPASAQSFCTCDGTGNVLPFSHKTDLVPGGKTAINDRALRAYASGTFGMLRSDGPEATGGGSAGYNEMLRNF